MQSPTAAAPAISFEKFLSKLEEYCFSERTLRVLQREPGFEELSDRSYRIYFVSEFLQRHEGWTLPRPQLSRVFEYYAARVKATLKNGLDDPQGLGRHYAFDNA
jgi:hypothetical protein